MKKEKTIPELAKEFPEKTYRELEKYRDADRIEEAIGMGHNQPPADGEEQDNPELFKTEIDYHRYWKDMYEKEHKLRQEAETETILVKGIGMNSPEMKDAKKTIAELRATTERFGRENNDLYNRIANLNETLKSKDYFEKPDYKFLVDENHRLEQQYLEVMADNKKLSRQIEDKMDKLRKSGM